MRPFPFAAALLLGGLVVVAAVGQAPAPQMPAKAVAAPAAEEVKDKAKDDMAKEMDKKPAWPTEIAGRDAASYVKDTTDRDPHIRLVALQALAQFGPDAKSTASKALVKALAAETRTSGDTAVAIAVVETINAIGLDSGPDMKEACRLLGLMITENTPNKTLYRMHAIPALSSFGHEADNAVTLFSASDVIGDRSYEIRKAAISAMAHVGLDEFKGPNPRALEALCGMTAASPSGIKDPSVAVRIEAFHVLVEMGPPIKPRVKGAKGPVVIDKALAARYLKPIQDRLDVEKSKGDKQVEVWARVAVMRFEPDKEINAKNLNELALLISKGDTATKLHALTGISLLGERAEGQLRTIMDQLETGDPLILDAAVRTLMAMKDKAKPAIPAIKDALEKRPEPYFKGLMENAIKFIEESKPAGSTESPTPSDPKPVMPAKK